MPLSAPLTAPLTGRLEHVNISVSDPERTAALLGPLTGWHRRWEGPAMNGGRTIHLGDERAYLAIYANPATSGRFQTGKPLNHIGIVVGDLAAAERIVADAGLEPFNQGTYDPGPSSFYFKDWDGIEFELVAYA